MRVVGRSAGVWPFLAGLALGAVAAAWTGPGRRRRLDPRVVRSLARPARATMVVFVPGILGSQLLRPDGGEAWLNLGNTLGHHDLSLPMKLPLGSGRDALVPGLLVGTDALLPRVFGFTEYADVLEMLDAAGYEPGTGAGLRYSVYTYDWRRDLVEAARGLALRLEGLAREVGDADARFHIVGHSMGGLIVRYYLRHGGAEPAPETPVTWAGARRTASAVLAATPSAGGIAALEAVLSGERVGLSHTTLAASVVRRMPSIYQLLPPSAARPLVDPAGHPVDADLLDLATWERYGWGAFAPDTTAGGHAEREYLAAALARARAFQQSLARLPQTPCPVPVHALGGDCLPTLARGIAGEGPPGTPPRFEARTRKEQDLLFEPGDGRVTRSSVLGAPEIGPAFFGSADHHGLYADPAVQSVLLRLLLRPPEARVAA